MENITSIATLEDAIQQLEYKQAVQGALLKEQFYVISERFKLINILRSTLHEVASSPHFTEGILSTAVGLASGYLSKKIVVAGSGNLLRKLFGIITQLGVTNVVTEHPRSIKSIGQYLFQQILRKKE